MSKAVVVLAGMLLFAAVARADFYKYRDSSGALVITDKLENVPQKYRNQFKVVWDKDLEAKDPLARRKAQARAQQERQEQQRQVEEQRQKKVVRKGAGGGQRLVVEFDETTGKVIKRFEDVPPEEAASGDRSRP